MRIPSIPVQPKPATDNLPQARLGKFPGVGVVRASDAVIPAALPHLYDLAVVKGYEHLGTGHVQRIWFEHRTNPSESRVMAFLVFGQQWLIAELNALTKYAPISHRA